MLVSAVKFEGVTNDKNDAADNGKHTRDDWREDLLRRTRPHQVEENTELPGAEGEDHNNAPSEGRSQRNRREPAYLRDYVHWAGDCDEEN